MTFHQILKWKTKSLNYRVADVQIVLLTTPISQIQSPLIINNSLKKEPLKSSEPVSNQLAVQHSYKPPLQIQSPLIIKDSMKKQPLLSDSPPSVQVVPSTRSYQPPKQLQAPPLVIKDSMKKQPLQSSEPVLNQLSITPSYRSPVQRQSSPLLIKDSMNKESFRSVSPVSSQLPQSQRQYRSPKPQQLQAPPLVIKDSLKKAINNPQDSLHEGNSQIDSQIQKSSRSPSSNYLNPKQVQPPPLISNRMKNTVSSSSASYMIPLIDISQEEIQSPK
ncbi:MAG: hypothetical protein EZS28_045329 [Streblomastix strix]|uniref:Uncharacterized protein n=1 Tax=Streblomastix strix TaxID=222440 RepID=A0A5J4TL74_9EUKA|nr:MAG: hypothetical protein EZS28_045329 [Streblomastix strix]